jgi:hypothetical protein
MTCLEDTSNYEYLGSVVLYVDAALSALFLLGALGIRFSQVVLFWKLHSGHLTQKFEAKRKSSHADNTTKSHQYFQHTWNL